MVRLKLYLWSSYVKNIRARKKKKNYDFMCKLWSAFIRVLRQNYMT